MEARKDVAMQIRLLGSVMIVAACGAFGFVIAAAYNREVKTLRQLIGMLDYMECELQYRLTPLPDLVRQAALETSGILRDLFGELSNELEDQISPNVANCMRAVMEQHREIPPITADCLQTLGQVMGRFDLQGQLNGLDSVRQICRKKLDILEHDKHVRLRSYQTLGICAGAALAILLI